MDKHAKIPDLLRNFMECDSRKGGKADFCIYGKTAADDEPVNEVMDSITY